MIPPPLLVAVVWPCEIVMPDNETEFVLEPLMLNTCVTLLPLTVSRFDPGPAMVTGPTDESTPDVNVIVLGVEK